MKYICEIETKRTWNVASFEQKAARFFNFYLICLNWYLGTSENLKRWFLGKIRQKAFQVIYWENLRYKQFGHRFLNLKLKLPISFSLENFEKRCQKITFLRDSYIPNNLWLYSLYFQSIEKTGFSRIDVIYYFEL